MCLWESYKRKIHYKIARKTGTQETLLFPDKLLEEKDWNDKGKEDTLIKKERTGTRDEDYCGPGLDNTRLFIVLQAHAFGFYKTKAHTTAYSQWKEKCKPIKDFSITCLNLEDIRL